VNSAKVHTTGIGLCIIRSQLVQLNVQISQAGAATDLKRDDTDRCRSYDITASSAVHVKLSQGKKDYNRSTFPKLSQKLYKSAFLWLITIWP